MPGIHLIHPFSTITTGLLQTGGILETGSLRDIHLIRNGETFSSFDFYQYLLSGFTDNDFRLLDGDVIFVPVRHSTIAIEGAILREAIYELLDNETIEDLINYSEIYLFLRIGNLYCTRANKPNKVPEKIRSP